MKKIVMMIGMCMLMLGGEAVAACVGTVTATTPTSDFIDNGDGTITHTKNGLMWKQCSEGLSGAACATGTATRSSWQAALRAAQILNNGGGFATYTDWRLPNIKELASILELQCGSPAINATIFPATAMPTYWSASPFAGNATYAWFVNFNGGSDDAFLKSTLYYVRLVRGGQ